MKPKITYQGPGDAAPRVIEGAGFDLHHIPTMGLHELSAEFRRRQPCCGKQPAPSPPR